ncbi:EcsC family protein [Lederbergia lenta]|uniref:Protein EcsC n=1 Tax=Lederbergia lenta TaxID=1467 RepID=A0A2X4W7P6_LEDLE|nr:EcsC family protein [Lederbergia lenta]MEC2325504.1 EcsC family protein [Lederbergia lenta]SQI54952.1 protein EcsC [Lederbergia lenta]
MNLTKRDEKLWEELQDWRQSFFEYEATDFENAYDKWMDQIFTLLPLTLQAQFFEKMDNWFFQVNSLIRGTQFQNEIRTRILNAARSMSSEIATLDDMRQLPVDQLTFLAEQQAAKHRLYSLIQGGAAGSGQPILIGSDFLSTIVINLRAVQVIAMSYGYDVQSPAGLLETVKVYNTATMPDRLKMFGWEDLMDDLQKSDEAFYFDIHERIIDQTWLDEPLKQMLKISLILMFSRKKVSGVPLLSMAIGAGVNYNTTRQVTQFAVKYYQYKHMLEKNGDLT